LTDGICSILLLLLLLFTAATAAVDCCACGACCSECLTIPSSAVCSRLAMPTAAAPAAAAAAAPATAAALELLPLAAMADELLQELPDLLSVDCAWVEPTRKALQDLQQKHRHNITP
jgi:hypothetical protein